MTDTLLAAFQPPSVRSEDWRYSRVDRIAVDAYRPLDESLRVTGAEFTPLSESAAGGVVGPYSDPFTDLNAQLCRDAVLIEVPAGARLEQPIDVAHLAAAGGLSCPRILVRVGEGASVDIIERSPSEPDALVVQVTELVVGAGAHVRHVGSQSAAFNTNLVGRVAATVEAGATLELFHVALGGDYARQRFDTHLVGEGAVGNISALYLGGGDQMHDLRTFQNHRAPRTRSNLLFKGALDDRSHAVYAGMIRIAETGAGSDAVQSNRIVKLSNDAWADSVPNLEIENDDVSCAHSSTVGPIDADQAFYLASRGVRPEVAERLVVNGFFTEVLDQLPLISAEARAAVARRIER
jgi:Fe-S cluster assembly protein SufD